MDMIETEVKVMNFVDIKFKAMDFMEIKVKVTNVTGRVVNAIHFTEIIIGHGHGRMEINYMVMEFMEMEVKAMHSWKSVVVMDLWKQSSV